MAAIMIFSMLVGTASIAQAALLTEQEHWKYHINKWAWDEERRRTYGLINPQIIIQNETAHMLEGFVADTNGTRLDMYDGEQVVHVRFLSNDGIGASAWQIAGRVYDGNFRIEIPAKNQEAELVRIFIGNNEYTVNNGTPSTPQTQVFINSATLIYSTNSTLDQMETEVALEEPNPLKSVYQGGSLLDWILIQNGMLPVRSPDSGK
jgi:hypothetical protein